MQTQGPSAGVTAATASAPPRGVGPAAVLSTLARIESTLRASRYAHATRVDEHAGRYDFDCSGMAAWVLGRSAPVAQASVGARATGGRPLARDYYEQIAATPVGRPRLGWERVARVADAAPGDVIAWLRPREVRSTNTGHVAFLVDPPEPVKGVPHAFLVRVADASRHRHQDDSRAVDKRTGFGRGTILVVAHPEVGAPVAYGWAGLRSAGVSRTPMAIGRPLR